MLATRAKPHQSRGLGTHEMVSILKHCTFVFPEQGQIGQELKVED